MEEKRGLSTLCVHGGELKDVGSSAQSVGSRRG